MFLWFGESHQLFTFCYIYLIILSTNINSYFFQNHLKLSCFSCPLTVVSLVFNLGDCLAILCIFHNTDFWKSSGQLFWRMSLNLDLCVFLFSTITVRENIFEYYLVMMCPFQKISGAICWDVKFHWLSWVEILAAYFASWAVWLLRRFSQLSRAIIILVSQGCWIDMCKALKTVSGTL